jgi:hypothetical protein
MSTTAAEAQIPVQTPPDRVTADPVAAPLAASTESTAAMPASVESKDKDSKAGKSKGKDSKGKKGKDSKATNDAGEASGSPSVSAHPRAARSVAQAKSWGGLAGFFIAGYLSLPTGTLAEAALRALVAGSLCYVVAWAGAVFAWRRLIVIEIKGREQQLMSLQTAQSEPMATAVEPSRARTAS